MRRSGVFGLALALVPGVLQAQAFRITPTVQPEIRAGMVASRESLLLAGLALNIPAGYYVRVAASAEAGTVVRDRRGSAARAEVVGRFMTDPFHQSRWGLYGGGGATSVWTEGTRARAALLIVAGVEFPDTAGWTRALELAGGGGVRLSLSFKPKRRLGR